MRYQGRVTDWKDDKGFGFVLPNGGGPRVFVHIKSFTNQRRRPIGKELVTYELSVDSRGRPQGVNVAFVGEEAAAPAATSSPGPGPVALMFAATFLLVVVVAVTVGRVPIPVLLVYLGASSLAYLAYVFDKAAAVQGKWRSTEQSLHLFSMFGGWPGAILAQKTIRHKTQKRSFQVTFWATVVLNCMGFGLLLSPSGVRIAKSLLGFA